MICEETAGFGLQASGFRLILSAVLVSLTIVVSVRAESSPSANVRFAGSDEATVGQKLPVALQLANTSAADIRQVRIKTNQLFEYRLDVLIPARETGDVTFEPWYFDGSLKLSAIEGLDGAGQVAVRYEPAELKPRVGAVGTSSEDMPAEQAWHQLAARTHVRPDLIGYADQDKGQIPSTLFSSRSWQLKDEWHFLIPAIVVAVLLVVLALVGDLLSRRVKLAALVVVVLGGAGWTVARAGAEPLAMVDAVTVVYHDGATGRSFTEYLAAVTALRSKMVTLNFNGGAQPRPLMAAEADRVIYEGVILHRHTGWQWWTVEKIPATPGLILAFGVEYWDQWPKQTGEMYWVQSGVPGVRLAGNVEQDRLFEPWCYLADRAWRMGPVVDGYRPVGDSFSIDAAVFSLKSEFAPFWQRTMRWVAKEYPRLGVGVFFGCPRFEVIAGRPEITSPDAKMDYYSKIQFWIFPAPPEP